MIFLHNLKRLIHAWQQAEVSLRWVLTHFTFSAGVCTQRYVNTNSSNCEQSIAIFVYEIVSGLNALELIMVNAYYYFKSMCDGENVTKWKKMHMPLSQHNKDHSKSCY